MRNWYGDAMDFTIADKMYMISSNGETFIVLDPGKWTWTAHIPKYGVAHGEATIEVGKLFLQQFLVP